MTILWSLQLSDKARVIKSLLGVPVLLLKKLTGALIFGCTLLVKPCCQNNAIESHKSVISVVKNSGIKLQLLISMCISVGASCGILWPCIEWSKTENVKEIRTILNLMEVVHWLVRFNFQGVHPGFQTLKIQGAPWVVLHSGCVQNSAAQPSGCIPVSVIQHSGCIPHYVDQNLGCALVSEV